MTDQSIELECRQCGASFLLLPAETAFRLEHGMPQPDTCPTCRAERRTNRHADLMNGADNEAGNGRGPSRVRKLAANGGPGGKMYSATCDQCGGAARVPFIPRGDRPVYCRDCFNARKGR